jgi:hypothetical protein
MIQGIAMVTRRKLIFSGTAALLAGIPLRHAGAADDPVGILAAIYARVAKGKGDSGGRSWCRRLPDRNTCQGAHLAVGQSRRPYEEGRQRAD